MGFIKNGDLYITGRLKDVIIIRGKTIIRKISNALLRWHILLFVKVVLRQ